MQSNLARNAAVPAESLYDRLGGRPCLDRVHRRLYDRIYAHPVLSAFFVGKDQRYQESQQSDFMAGEFGGPHDYRGRLPNCAHPHLFVTDAHFELRHAILAETLEACGVAPDLRDRWLLIDRRFKGVIVKQAVGECEKRYTTDEISSRRNRNAAHRCPHHPSCPRRRVSTSFFVFPVFGGCSKRKKVVDTPLCGA